MADEKAQKKTIRQSLAIAQESLRKIGQEIVPRLGYIYILLLACATAYVIMTVNQTFELSSDISSNGLSPTGAQGSTATNFTFTFDPTTVAKVKALNNDAASMTVSLPGGRINPFAE